MSVKDFSPSQYQNPIDWKASCLPAPKPTEDSLQLDVLFIGAGPASLSSAIKLMQIAKKQNQTLEVGIMEKASTLGGHSLSGAVINPCILQELFPEKKISDLPLRKEVKKENFYWLTQKTTWPLIVPPGMKSKKYFTASLSEIVKWLGQEAEKMGIHIFCDHPAEALLMEDNCVVGVQARSYGENKDGTKETNSQPSFPVYSKATVLSEGSRGHLTQAYLQHQNIKTKYPQTYALGVKEIWKVKKEPKGILHSIGWPLHNKTFGGSWMYPIGENLISLGLVAGLDSPSQNLSIHDKLQELKQHPLFDKYLKDGQLVEWGAKTIPEGGWHALPNRLHGDRLLIIGDSAGFVNMNSLKGIHYAMASGVFAAETLFEAYTKKDFSKNILKNYDQKIKNSFLKKDLYPVRNLRQSFHRGLFWGLFKSLLITFTRGKWPNDITSPQVEDAKVKRTIYEKPLPHKGVSKQDAVYLSGNKTRDKVKSHLTLNSNLPKEIETFYERFCPAKVYEKTEKGLTVQAPNCIDCKATDILGPRWRVRERGSGPNYKLM